MRTIVFAFLMILAVGGFSQCTNVPFQAFLDDDFTIYVYSFDSTYADTISAISIDPDFSIDTTLCLPDGCYFIDTDYSGPNDVEITIDLGLGKPEDETVQSGQPFFFGINDGCSGCLDPLACNYEPLSLSDDGSCVYPGCLDPLACDYDSGAGCPDLCCYDACGFITTSDNSGVISFEFFQEGSGSKFPTFTLFVTGDTSEPLCLESGCYAVFVTSPDIDAVWTIEGYTPSSVSGVSSGGFSLEVDAVFGCLDEFALNYDSTATCDDGNCAYCDGSLFCGPNTVWNGSECVGVASNPCPFDTDGNGVINTADMLSFLTAFGTSCP